MDKHTPYTVGLEAGRSMGANALAAEIRFYERLTFGAAASPLIIKSARTGAEDVGLAALGGKLDGLRAALAERTARHPAGGGS